MTAAIARVRATYSNAGDHRENAANAMVAIEPSTASHLSEVALCGAVSRYKEAVLPPGPSSYFNLTPKRARMEGFIILDYVPRFPGALEALGRWQSEGKLVQKRMWLSVYASPSKSGPSPIWMRSCCRGDGKALARPMGYSERCVPTRASA